MCFFYGFSEMLRLGCPRRVKIRGYSHAGVAELADAQDSGSCGGNFVKVQVLSPAPKIRNRMVSDFFRVGEDLNLVPSEQVQDDSEIWSCGALRRLRFPHSLFPSGASAKTVPRTLFALLTFHPRGLLRRDEKQSKYKRSCRMKFMFLVRARTCPLFLRNRFKTARKYGRAWRSAGSASRTPYFHRARRRKPSPGRFSPCLLFTRVGRLFKIKK